VFSHTDMVTDSENFYHSILDLLEDPDECEEVVELMTWWTWFVVHSFNLKSSKLTLYKVEFFLIHPIHSRASVQTVPCPKFV